MKTFKIPKQQSSLPSKEFVDHKPPNASPFASKQPSNLSCKLPLQKPLKCTLHFFWPQTIPKSPPNSNLIFFLKHSPIHTQKLPYLCPLTSNFESPKIWPNFCPKTPKISPPTLLNSRDQATPMQSGITRKTQKD